MSFSSNDFSINGESHIPCACGKPDASVVFKKQFAIYFDEVPLNHVACENCFEIMAKKNTRSIKFKMAEIKSNYDGTGSPVH